MKRLIEKPPLKFICTGCDTTFESDEYWVLSFGKVASRCINYGYGCVDDACLIPQQ